jgi:hypothetical protein
MAALSLTAGRRRDPGRGIATTRAPPPYTCLANGALDGVHPREDTAAALGAADAAPR